MNEAYQSAQTYLANPEVVDRDLAYTAMGLSAIDIGWSIKRAYQNINQDIKNGKMEFMRKVWGMEMTNFTDEQVEKFIQELEKN